MEEKIFDKLEAIEKALLRIASALEDSNTLNEKIEKRNVLKQVKSERSVKKSNRPSKINLNNINQ